MRPASGRNRPVNRLMTVVLPAPFGPIKACREPCSIRSESVLAATMPPNRLPRFIVSSAAGMGSRSLGARNGAGAAREAHAPLGPGEHGTHRGGPCGHAVATDQHDDNQDEADPELPVLRREVGKPVLHQL